MMKGMTHRMKFIAMMVLTLFVLASCARMREKKAEKHQPFSPHKNKKPQHAHPQDHNHHHPHHH